MIKLSSLLLILAIGFGISATAAPWQPVGHYAHPPIRESSGIVASRQFEGVYWTLNDSGNPATLYATKRNGELIQEIALHGSLNVDWEALGIDEKNQLWIGEIGNNSRLRFDLKVVVIAEPNPFTETAAEVIASYPYRYPNENVDAEGLFVIEGIPYIVSKEPTRAVLYRFPTLQPDTKQVLERVGEFADAKLVTGAAISEDGSRLALCSYHLLWVYDMMTGDLAHSIRTTPWHLTHGFAGEAVCFDNYDLVLTNEARDLYHLPQFWYEKEWPLPPKNMQPAIDLLPQATAHNATFQRSDYRAEGINISGSHLTFTPKVGEHIASVTLPIEAPYADLYEIRAVLTRGPAYGQVQLSLGGDTIGPVYDSYASAPRAGTLVSFGTAPLKAGQNLLTFTIVGKSPEAADSKIGIDSYQVLHAAPYATTYAVLGPFTKESAPALPDKSRVDMANVYTGIDGKAIRWQEVRTKADGYLDLREALGPTPMTLGYTLVYVHAPKQMDSVMLIGSDDEIVVWLNGAEIHRKRIDAGATADSDAVPCQLNAGWNAVLCQKIDLGWSWGLYLRFTDADQVLKYATHPD